LQICEGKEVHTTIKASPLLGHVFCQPCSGKLVVRTAESLSIF